MLIRILAFAILFSFACPVLSHAEALDDASIRAMYKLQADSIHDPDKTLELMQTQLSDEFMLQQKITFDFGKGKPRINEQTMSKAQVIGAQRESGQNEKIEKFENTIASIKYSADKKFAYVDDTTTAVKTIMVPGAGGQTMEVHATEGGACLDTLALIDGAIKHVKSKCYVKVMIAK